MPKRMIEDPTRPEGYRWGYESAEECLAEYEADLKRSEAEVAFTRIAAWTALGILIALTVILSVAAGLMKR